MMEGVAAVATVSSVLGTTIKVAEKVFDIYGVDEQARAVLETVDQVSRQLHNARTLRRERSALFTSSEKKMFDESFQHTEDAIRRVAAHAERARVDMEVSGGKVRANTRVLFVLRDSPNIHVSLTRLGIATQTLNGVFSTLCSRVERSRDSISSSTTPRRSSGDHRPPPTYEESQFLYEGRRRNLQRRASAMTAARAPAAPLPTPEPTHAARSASPSIRSQASSSSLLNHPPHPASQEPTFAAPPSSTFGMPITASPTVSPHSSFSGPSGPPMPMRLSSSYPSPFGSPSIGSQAPTFPQPSAAPVAQVSTDTVPRSPAISFASVEQLETFSELSMSELAGGEYNPDAPDPSIPTGVIRIRSNSTGDLASVPELPTHAGDDVVAQNSTPSINAGQAASMCMTDSSETLVELPISRYDAYDPKMPVSRKSVKGKAPSTEVSLPESIAELPISAYDAYVPGREQSPAAVDQPMATLKGTYIPNIAELAVSQYDAYSTRQSRSSIGTVETTSSASPATVQDPASTPIPRIHVADDRSLPIPFTPDGNATSMPIPIAPDHRETSIPIPVSPDRSATSMPVPVTTDHNPPSIPTAVNTAAAPRRQLTSDEILAAIPAALSTAAAPQRQITTDHILASIPTAANTAAANTAAAPQRPPTMEALNPATTGWNPERLKSRRDRSSRWLESRIG